MVRAGCSHAVELAWENDVQDKTRVKRIKVITRKKTNNSRILLAKAGLCLFIYAIILVLLCIKSATMGYKIVELKNEIAQLESANKKMDYQIASTQSLDYIEKVAVDELGMYRPEKHITVAVTEAKGENMINVAQTPEVLQTRAGNDFLQKIYASLIQLADKNN